MIPMVSSRSTGKPINNIILNTRKQTNMATTSFAPEPNNQAQPVQAPVAPKTPVPQAPASVQTVPLQQPVKTQAPVLQPAPVVQVPLQQPVQVQAPAQQTVVPVSLQQPAQVLAPAPQPQPVGNWAQAQVDPNTGYPIHPDPNAGPAWMFAGQPQVQQPAQPQMFGQPLPQAVPQAAPAPEEVRYLDPVGAQRALATQQTTGLAIQASERSDIQGELSVRDFQFPRLNIVQPQSKDLSAVFPLGSLILDKAGEIAKVGHPILFVPLAINLQWQQKLPWGMTPNVVTTEAEIRNLGGTTVYSNENVQAGLWYQRLGHLVLAILMPPNTLPENQDRFPHEFGQDRWARAVFSVGGTNYKAFMPPIISTTSGLCREGLYHAQWYMVSQETKNEKGRWFAPKGTLKGRWDAPHIGRPDYLDFFRGLLPS